MQEEGGVGYKVQQFPKVQLLPLNYMISCLDAEFPGLWMKVGLNLLEMESIQGHTAWGGC